MSKQRTRMTDIAARAQVSTATVSRVFNGVGQVSEATRAKVLTAIDELGYERPVLEPTSGVPNVGVILPELTNPIFSAFAHNLQNAIAGSGGVAMLRSQTPGATSELDHLESLIAHDVDGIIFVSGRHADYLGDLNRYQDLTDRRIPFVTINGARPEIAAPDFSTGDAAGIRAAVGHLAQLGHRNIALLTGRSHVVPSARKLAAFREIMSELFDVEDPLTAETFYTYEAAAAATGPLIRAGATAVVCGSDMQALGVIRALRDAGLSVPDDVSVVGYDDTFLMSHVDPALTTVRQPVNAITNAAVQTLFDAIGSARTLVHEDYVYNPDLVVRSSTAPMRPRS